ncbi:type II toxin-antitoxin system PemK/MazF family toxin [Rhizobium sp. AG855]|uniref:type II toxin-antitoxin system PemK/MazF family toxin n=1 Tax=Rhizobium sp. AG855 TaxID=2183898 RepID=UPI000E71168D|nr:type II toxin-antitoxin system PemK/MazF family toxin [Rhizobium sp. AG855]RKE85641.1 mRNA interferase MazF [Rhizobium sp. AG855]
MRRGEIWTVAGAGDYAGKPRPAVIVQDDSFIETGSVTLCGFTSDETEAPLFRIPVEPTDSNGLVGASRLMADKITTVAKGKLGRRIGALDTSDMVRLERAMLVFLGLAGSTSRRE